MISLDTETTGIDLRHGAKPFFVTTCNEQGEVTFWEWDVDPYTREPQIPEEDAREIRQLLAIQHDGIVLQNPKFDVTALLAGEITDWTPLWELTYDTLLAGHLLASNHPHDLTSMALEYLGVDIEPYEKKLKEAVTEARRLCRSKLPDWRIAKEGLEEMPSASSKTAGYDYWLPRAVCKYATEVCSRKFTQNGVTYIAEQPFWREYADPDHPWWTVLQEYSNADSSVTLPLFKTMKEEIERRGLWKIYKERLKLLEVSYDLERYGVTENRKRHMEIKDRFKKESEEAGMACVSIAEKYKEQCEDCKGTGFSYPNAPDLFTESTLFCSSCGGNGYLTFDLELPKSGNNNSLLRFAFSKEGLNLPRHHKATAKTDRPAFDKNIIDEYEVTLPPGHALEFVKNLKAKRLRDTGIQYMEGYERYWLSHPSGKGWARLHGSANPTGTDTLRWSFSNPNTANISKRESFNLRYPFGPAPGREWYSMDGQNLELRIPVYEAGEKDIIYIFEHPEEPPYFGSYHLFIFDLLHPEMFKEHGKKCKQVFESTWYQWVKNGNFAIIYGAQEAKADATYHSRGAYKKIRYRFPRVAQLADKQITLANKRGYVETIPDTTIDSERGYPLLCSRSEWGKVLPTTPLNYHVSGTAMQWTNKAMIRCSGRIKEWNKKGFDAFITLQVHDELVFDMPAGNPFGPGGRLIPEPKMSNLWRVQELQKLMEQGGEDIGVPTPVSVEYHPVTWAEGTAI